MGRTELYKKAITTYGGESQRRVAIEEMSELTKELCKWDRGQENRLHIAEEIADVKIMLEQLAIIYNCDELINDWYDYKLERLEQKLSE